MRRVLLVAAVVLGNAVVQALCVLPGATPAIDPLFLALLAASVFSLVAAATAVIALVGGPGARWLRALAAVVVALVVVGALAVVSSATVVPSLLVAFVLVSPAGDPDATAWGGLRAFARHPVRAVLLAVVTMLVIAVLVVAALLLGFLVTGWLGSLLTWIVAGAAAALLVRAWAGLVRRRVDLSTAGPAARTARTD